MWEASFRHQAKYLLHDGNTANSNKAELMEASELFS